MNKVLGDCLDRFASVYIDDILVLQQDSGRTHGTRPNGAPKVA